MFGIVRVAMQNKRLEIAAVLIILLSFPFFFYLVPNISNALSNSTAEVDISLGDDDLNCSVPTGDPNISRLAPITFIDGNGGYDTAEEATTYFKVHLPKLPLQDLQKSQFNSVIARFEVPNKGVFIVQKNDGLWQPSVYSVCPDLDWDKAN